MITDELLFEVAVDYYLNNMLQKDIANKIGVSRVQVSKYLKLAQEKGIVNIEVIPPRISDDLSEKYSAIFKSVFGLEKLILTRGHSNQELLLASLAKSTYRYLSDEDFNGNLKVGIAWGSTVFNIATCDEKLEHPNWTIIPLSGGTTKISDKHFNMNYLTQSFADRMGAQALAVYLPFYIGNDEERENTLKSKEYNDIQKYWNSLDVIICSAGYSISRSPMFRQHVIQGDYLNKLEELGVVGDVVTHYFDINGRIHDLEYMEKVTNISLKQYMNAKKRIVVAGGMHKIDSIVGLLRGKLADVLISDIKTVENVVEYISEINKEE